MYIIVSIVRITEVPNVRIAIFPPFISFLPKGPLKENEFSYSDKLFAPFKAME